MNFQLTKVEIQNYIHDHVNSDLREIVLRGISFQEVTAAEIAQQIHGLKTIRTKAPFFAQKRILFPERLHLEQTSSQLTAEYKTSLIKEGNTFIDLTGGFGVDTYFLSRKFEDPHYCEIKLELATIAKHNFEVLSAGIEINNTDGIEFLKNHDREFDLIFIDPSRRNDKKGKVISLEWSEPNLIEYWSLLLKKGRKVMVKLSPVLDIHYILQTLSDIQQVHVVSVKNDVKEIVVLASQEFHQECELTAAEHDYDSVFTYQKKGRNEIEFLDIEDIVYQKFLYEPLGALLKVNAQNEYAENFKLKKLAQNSHFYLSTESKQPNLMKVYKIIDSFPFHKKELKTRFQKQLLNVICRNFPLKPEEVLRQLNIKQGGNQFLICSRNSQNQNVCFLCER